jgi:diguanylate cyclase (GGDEF)-like protein
MAVSAVLLTFAAQAGRDIAGWEWLLATVFLGLFIVVDGTRLRLRLELRRHATSLSLIEIPLLLALFYLAPVLVVLVRVAAGLVVRIRRGQSQVKMWFNAAAFAAATAAAAAIVANFGSGTDRAGGRPFDDVSPHTWLVLGAAVGASVLVALFGVVGVITVTQGAISSSDLVRIVVPSVLVGFVNITFGLIVLIVLQQSVWASVLIAVLVVFFVIGYRSYAQFLRQHRTLTEMYELTRAVRDATYEGTLSDALLHRVREMLRAEYATLWLPAQGRHPEVLLTAQVDNVGLLDVTAVPELVRRQAFDTGETVVVTATTGDIELRQELNRTGLKDAIVVPLRSGSVVVGCLEVAGRLVDPLSFSGADTRLLEAVATHVAVAVENSRLVDRLRFDAYHDSLTGLPNRRRMTQALEESVKVRAPGEVVALLLFDVDGMRDVNESLGHSAGDKLLAEVAKRLRAIAPAAALVGRASSDEFVVTLRTESADSAVALAEELRGKLRDPMVLGNLTLDVDTAVGVAVHPDHGTDSATLLQRADLAAQAAESLPSGVQLFNPALESRSVRRLGLANDLRRTLDNNELEIYFQPKVSLRDRRLVGVECLARWEHPTHGQVAPEDFVAVAEHTGQLSRLTEAVLREGLRRCHQWADAGRPLNVAVNLSPRTLVDPDFPARVETLLREYAVAPERVTFEITEDGVVGDSDRPMPTLHRLRDIGVRLSVDDFGTGYSSLSYLRRLPVHEVKIDRTFVQGMATDPGDLAIVRAVVDLSRHFGLSVVAEGVESELTLDLLEEIGCDIGQGFLFSRPLPYERLEAWFGAQTEAEPTPMGEVRRLRAVT